jgi:hypothetical protein
MLLSVESPSIAPPHLARPARFKIFFIIADEQYKNKGSARGPPTLKKRLNVTTNQENLSASVPTLCRKCRQSIVAHSETDFLDKFSNFVRLRCTAPECGHEDWYMDVQLNEEKHAPTADTGSGEVWVHDAMLGLSFRADASAPSDSGLGASDVHR